MKGNRLAHPDVQVRMPRIRRVGTRALTTLTRWVTGLASLQDAQCGFTAISREMLQSLPLDSLYPRYGYPNDLIAMLVAIDARIDEVPVTPVYAGERSDLRPALALFTHSWVLLRALALRRRRTRGAREAQNLGTLTPRTKWVTQRPRPGS